MKKLRNFLMIGAAVAAVAAVATGPALAQTLRYHDMTMQSPDGTITHIRYAGNTPPKVEFASPDQSILADVADSAPFVQMDRISAAMDRQADALWRAVGASDPFTFASPQTVAARLSHLPPGTEGYSVVSYSAGGKTCTEKMAYSYDGHGKPMIENASTGDCGAGASSSGASNGAAPMKVQAENPVAHTLKHDWHVIEAAL